MQETFEETFSVNSSTGDIFLHRALDRELEPHFQLQIVAVDTGKSWSFFIFCRGKIFFLFFW
jgi:hypothetical protein